MKLTPFFLIIACFFLAACGENEEAQLNETIDQLEVVFDDKPEAEVDPDYPAPPMKARKVLSAQVKEASSYMREEKYEEAMGVLSSVRTSPYVDASQKRVIDDAMRKTQKNLARLKHSGQLSAAEEARIRRELSGR